MQCAYSKIEKQKSKHENSSIAIHKKNDNYKVDEGWKVFRGVSVVNAEGVQI